MSEWAIDMLDEARAEVAELIKERDAKIAKLVREHAALLEEASEQIASLIKERDALLKEVRERSAEAEEAEDVVWEQRAGGKRCRCGHWVNSPSCQYAHSKEG